MGFLSSILSDALSKGIQNGLGKVVSDAVEKIVKPSVDNMAKQQAGRIDDLNNTIRKAEAQAVAANAANFKLEDLSAADAEVLKQMQEKLPQYPLWTVGGCDFELQSYPEDDGKLNMSLTLTGTQTMLDAYKLLLLEAGFRYVNDNDQGDVIYKVIGGDCYTFIFTDAVTDDQVLVGFAVRNEYMPEK